MCYCAAIKRKAKIHQKAQSNCHTEQTRNRFVIRWDPISHEISFFVAGKHTISPTLLMSWPSIERQMLDSFLPRTDYRMQRGQPKGDLAWRSCGPVLCTLPTVLTSPSLPPLMQQPLRRKPHAADHIRMMSYHLSGTCLDVLALAFKKGKK